MTSLDLYAEYLRERRGYELLLDREHRGFAVYSYKQPYCYISDIYVRPDHRHTGMAREMADLLSEMAKDAGCTHLLGSIDMTTNGWEHSLHLLVQYGFVPLKMPGERQMVLEKRL